MTFDAAGGHFVSLLASFSRNSQFWARSTFLAVAGAIGLSGAFCVPPAAAEGKVQLSTDNAPRHRQVTTTLVAEGSLIIPEKQGKQRKLPIRIDGKLEFVDDTRPAGGNATEKSLRHYRVAEGKIVVDKQVDRLLLSPNRRLIAVDRNAAGLQLVAPAGPLTRADLELLEMQFDIAALAVLIPSGGVSKGDRWEVSAQLAAMLFGLDSAEKSTLRATAKTIAAGAVEITLAGEVTGAVDGAKAQIKLADSKLTFDRRAGQFSALAISFSEIREGSPTAPGFDLKSKLTSRIAAVADAPELSAAELHKVAPHWAPARPATQQLDFASAASEIGIVHDRTWHVTAHRRELIVLRKLIGDAQIAQCNITRLPSAGDDEALDLKQFEEQVQKTLGKNFGRIEEASQAQAEELSILRIVASGQASEVPVTWIYYHLAADDGRRAALVFTLASTDLERFATSDHDLIGGFRFLAAAAPAQAARPETEETR